MKNIATNDYKTQEELVAKGNRLHTEAIQQAMLFLPNELGRAIGKLFGGSNIAAYPAK